MAAPKPQKLDIGMAVTRQHCKNSLGTLTNKNGYLSFTFVLSTLGIEQMYKECGMCVATQEGLSGRIHDSPLVY